MGCVRRYLKVVVPCRFCILFDFPCQLKNWLRVQGVVPKLYCFGQQVPLCSTRSQPQDCRSLLNLLLLLHATGFSPALKKIIGARSEFTRACWLYTEALEFTHGTSRQQEKTERRQKDTRPEVNGGILQECPLSMVFVVALYVPWCRRLEVMPSVRPQLYADNLKCSADCPNTLFGAARFTAQYVMSVGQDVSRGQCVLLGASKAVRKAMKLWDVSGDGGFGKAQMDARDLGRHLDFTGRAGAGTLSKRTF